MNKWNQSLKKEYVTGLSTSVLVIVLAIIAIQLDWSKMLAGRDDSGTQTEFIQAGPFYIAVSLMPETPKVGKNSVRVAIKDRSQQPLENVRVKAIATMAAMASMPAMKASAVISSTGPGVYQGDFELPMAGSWMLVVEAATDDSHHVDLVFDLTTGRPGIRLSSATPAGDVAYYTCSMHHSVRSAVPGTCPICGMDLVPVTHEEQQSGGIVVEPGRRQTIGVKTGKVIRQAFSVPLHLYGEVRFDETRLLDISLHFDGWIGELKAGYEGQSIHQGDILFSVYSPELLSLQEQYRQTLKYSRYSAGKQRAALIAASRKRLRLSGLNAAQIRWLEKQRKAVDYLPIFAPADGVLLEKNILPGSAFKRGQSLLKLAKASALWIEAYAYEQDLALIQPGMRATVRLSHVGRSFETTVIQVDPFLNNTSRTLRLRLPVPVSESGLKAGLFAKVTLKADFGEQLLIPEQAILVSGEKRIVFVDQGQGRLKPVRIRTGFSDGVYTIVRRGLKEGDQVVVSGNFLIAAESKLKSGVGQW